MFGKSQYRFRPETIFKQNDSLDFKDTKKFDLGEFHKDFNCSLDYQDIPSCDKFNHKLGELKENEYTERIKTVKIEGNELKFNSELDEAYNTVFNDFDGMFNVGLSSNQELDEYIDDNFPPCDLFNNNFTDDIYYKNKLRGKTMTDMVLQKGRETGIRGLKKPVDNTFGTSSFNVEEYENNEWTDRDWDDAENDILNIKLFPDSDDDSIGDIPTIGALGVGVGLASSIPSVTTSIQEITEPTTGGNEKVQANISSLTGREQFLQEFRETVGKKKEPPFVATKEGKIADNKPSTKAKQVKETKSDASTTSTSTKKKIPVKSVVESTPKQSEKLTEKIADKPPFQPTKTKVALALEKCHDDELFSVLKNINDGNFTGNVKNKDMFHMPDGSSYTAPDYLSAALRLNTLHISWNVINNWIKSEISKRQLGLEGETRNISEIGKDLDEQLIRESSTMKQGIPEDVASAWNSIKVLEESLNLKQGIPEKPTQVLKVKKAKTLKLVKPK